MSYFTSYRAPPEIEGEAAPFGAGAPERRSYAAAYESVTAPFVTRARRELSLTLAAQPVFDLRREVAISRRIRRVIRDRGGQKALMGLGARTLEGADLKRIDLTTLKLGLDLLRLGPNDCGVLPAFWRTVATTQGRFAMLCAELQHAAAPGVLLIEVGGGAEAAPVETLNDIVAHFETEAMGLIVHVTPDAGVVAGLGGARVQCLALDFAGVHHQTAAAWDEAAHLIAVARSVAPTVMLLNLRPDRGQAATQAGATHAVFAEMSVLNV